METDTTLQVRKEQPHVRDDQQAEQESSYVDDTDAFEALREILLGQYRERLYQIQSELTEFQTSLDDLEQRINDDEALIETITPIIADSIRSSIRDSRGEMVEALNPIIAASIQASIRDSRNEMVDALMPIIADIIQASIRNSREEMVTALSPLVGRLVQRAVADAMRQLARTIDERLRNALKLQSPKERIKRALRIGVSQGEMALRNALPFEINEVFLIHRESGLPLRYLAQDEEAFPDSDLVSSMLTAIRDFVQDAFGHGEEGSLDEIQYGDKRILIEAAQYIYIAVVIEGVEPLGFRQEIREKLFAIEQAYFEILSEYDGDASQLVDADYHLRLLMSIPTTDPIADRAIEPTPTRKNIVSSWFRENRFESTTGSAQKLFYVILFLLSGISLVGIGWILFITIS